MPAPKRPNYFQSQFLIVRDFQDEQTYHDEMLRLHSLTMHDWGVVRDGLQVTRSGNDYVISRGSAIDSLGREIVLDDPTGGPPAAKVNQADVAAALAAAGAGQDVLITIAFREVDSTTDVDQYPPPGGSENVTRKVQSPVISLTKAPAPAGAVILASVKANGSVDYSTRRLASGFVRVGDSNDLSLDPGRNVGIGTTTPQFPLSFSDALGDKIALWGQSGNHYGFGIQPSLLQIYTDVTGSDVAFGYGSSGSFTQTMRVKGNGNVEIPTGTLQIGTAPTSVTKIDSKITHIFGDETNPRYTIDRDLLGSGQAGLGFNMRKVPSATLAANGSAVGIPTDRTLAFSTSDGTNLVERMRIDSDGNVGIGTTGALAARLHLGSGTLQIGTSPAFVTTIDSKITHKFGDETTPRYTIDRDLLGTGQAGIGFNTRKVPSVTIAANGSAVGIPTDRTLAFSTSDGTSLVERMRIDSAGNVSIVKDLSVTGLVTSARLNASRVGLRGTDDNHGIAYFGEGAKDDVGDFAIDGPVVHGYHGGALGVSTASDKKSKKIAIRWDINGRVGIGTSDIPARLIVRGLEQTESRGTVSTGTPAIGDLYPAAGANFGGIAPGDTVIINDERKVVQSGGIGQLIVSPPLTKAISSASQTPLYLVRPAPDPIFRVDDYKGNPQLLIRSDGNVGIGTTNPLDKLSVQGGALSFVNPHASNNVPYVGLDYDGASDKMRFRTNIGNSSLNTTAMVLDRTTGNVGIGTTKPLGPLSVGDSSVAKSDGYLVIGKNNGEGGSRHFRIGFDSVFNFVLGDYGAGNVAGTQWTSPFAVAYNAPSTSLYVAASGNVGIGTAPVRAKLEIAGNAANILVGTVGLLMRDNARFEVVNPTVQNGNVNLPLQNMSNFSANLSIYASDTIVGVSVAAFSDQRIKRIQGRSDSERDLATLLSIEVTDYSYKDALSRGFALHKKVIGQQVEQVFPQAVSRSTDVVPDIYQPAKTSEGWVALATTLQKGDRVRLISEKQDGIHEVLEVAGDRFRTDLTADPEQVFVYGREVNDFRNVDYDAIAMLNVSATQQLKKEVDTLRTEIAELKLVLDAIKKLQVLESTEASAPRLVGAKNGSNGNGRH